MWRPAGPAPVVRTARPRLVRVRRAYSAWRLVASFPLPLIRAARSRLVRVARTYSTEPWDVSHRLARRIMRAPLAQWLGVQWPNLSLGVYRATQRRQVLAEEAQEPSLGAAKGTL